MRELDSAQSQIEQEQAIKQIILSRLRRTTIVQAPQQEGVAYRLAEIFVAARQLYTEVLPGFLELAEKPADDGAVVDPGAPDDADDRVFEVFGDVRMNLLHLRDLVEDFEETFLESLSGRLQRQDGRSGEEDDDDDEA